MTALSRVLCLHPTLAVFSCSVLGGDEIGSQSFWVLLCFPLPLTHSLSLTQLT